MNGNPDPFMGDAGFPFQLVHDIGLNLSIGFLDHLPVSCKTSFCPGVTMARAGFGCKQGANHWLPTADPKRPGNNGNDRWCRIGPW
jgi:hypothetical protein